MKIFFFFLVVLIYSVFASIVQASCHKTFQDFAVLGTSINQGQPHKGVKKAFHHLKKTGFWEKTAALHKNLGALPFEKSTLIYEHLFYKTSEIINSGFRPALIGGDHSQSFATISSILNKHSELRVLWLDAHADLNTPTTSPSGNTHGMPVAGLMGLADRQVWNMPWLNQNLKPDRLIYLGIRDLDQGEIYFMKKHNIENYSPQQIRSKGLYNILSSIATKWSGKPVHFSFDIDALDGSLVPGTAFPVDKGLSLQEVLAIIDWAKKEFQLVSFEVTEFNPDLAKTKKELKVTEFHIQSVINSLLTP